MRLPLAVLALSLSAPALAVTGQAPPATGWAARAIVMVIDPRGDLCTGTALARDLVLTAAHCVARKERYEVKPYQTGKTIPVRGVAIHPRFDLANYARSRATADVALIKLAAPLPDVVVPAALAPARRVHVGETLTIAGFGTVADHSADGLGVPRMARLTVTGQPGSLQIRLVDPATRNLRPGLGACTGDSGAPAYDGEDARKSGQMIGQVIGIVSWTTAAGNEEGCGGLTGLTPLLLYRGWIVDTARKFDSPVGR
jgi:Trypsin